MNTTRTLQDAITSALNQAVSENHFQELLGYVAKDFNMTVAAVNNAVDNLNILGETL